MAEQDSQGLSRAPSATPSSRVPRIRSARMMTRVPWESQEHFLECARDISSAQGRRFDVGGSGSSTLRSGHVQLTNRDGSVASLLGMEVEVEGEHGTSSMDEFLEMDGFPPHLHSRNGSVVSLGGRLSTASVTNVGLPRDVGDVTASKHRVRARRLTGEKLQAWQVHDDFSSSDESDTESLSGIASSSRLRGNPQSDNPLITRYRELCKVYDCVPATFFEQNISSTRIAINSRTIGPKGAQAMAKILEDCEAEEIALRGNGIGNAGAIAFANTCRESAYLVLLDLSANHIGTEGVTALATMLKENMSLATFVLENNNVLDVDGVKLCDALKENNQLRVLRLAHNRIGSIAAAKFGDLLAANKALVELDLSYNCLQDRGGVLLARGLGQNTSLKRLLLDANGIGDGAATAIASALPSTGIELLSLAHNRIGLAGAKALAPAIRASSTLTTIILDYNNIPPEGILLILQAVKDNPNIKFCGIEGIALDDECKALLKLIQSERPEFESGGSVQTETMSMEELKETLKRAESSRRLSRRRSSVIVTDSFVRRPTTMFDPAWNADQAMEHGYNPDGSERSDIAWLSSVPEFNEEWSASEAWENGYYPDGTQRQTDQGLARRMSRASLMGQYSQTGSSASVARSEYKEFERRASTSFQIVYPNLADPMAIIDTYIQAKKIRLLEFFQQIDKDRNGKITVEEMTEGVALLDIPMNSVQAEEMIFRMDLDGDGTIDYHELVEAREEYYEETIGRRKQPKGPYYSDDSDVADSDASD
eukprot:m.45804 g.45804  ORF g.45804 m.45804 type:complete len:768 (+) comp10897_c0_seq2:347-2650(+)